MRPFLSFLILALCLIAVILFAIIGSLPSWSFFIPSGIGLLALISLFRGIVMPARTVNRGMELIKAQDFNNRLVKVGESNADRIVTLFNSLIDKLRAERLLNREQESLLKLLIDASPMGVVMLDFNNNITLVNSSFLKICGINDFKNLIGQRFVHINCDLLPDMLKVPLGKSEIIRKGNFRIYRCYHLNFIQEGFKREFYLLESLTEEIIKAEKAAYEKVIRTISHEVNNSLGGVRSVLEIVASTDIDEEIEKVIESCDNRCEKMCAFIQEYAEVVKLPQPVIRKLDLGQEIEIMLPFVRQLLSSDISLKYNQPEDEITVNADSEQLQQVMLNIIKNAAESIENRGWIEIKIGSKREGVELCISNNGKPIEEEISKQLFTPFFTTKVDGKGIGLTFIREVLNRHGADYSLKTDENGITRFNILFK